MKKSKIIYELVMGALALVAVILSVIDIAAGMNQIMSIADTIILIVFIVDYVIRLIMSKNKKEFIKNNILDLIAIIPFSSAFKVFRIAKLTRLTKLAKIGKLTKLSKLFTYTLRLSGRAKVFVNTNGFKYSLIITAVLTLFGAIGISQFENMKFEDAIWWAFVTATTVGYGDISPSTGLGRLIAVVLMITGIGLIGSLTSTITSYFFAVNKKSSSKEKILKEIQAQINDLDNLSTEDIDNICAVLKTLTVKQE